MATVRPRWSATRSIARDSSWRMRRSRGCCDERRHDQRRRRARAALEQRLRRARALAAASPSRLPSASSSSGFAATVRVKRNSSPSTSAPRRRARRGAHGELFDRRRRGRRHEDQRCATAVVSSDTVVGCKRLAEHVGDHLARGASADAAESASAPPSCDESPTARAAANSSPATVEVDARRGVERRRRRRQRPEWSRCPLRRCLRRRLGRLELGEEAVDDGLSLLVVGRATRR